MDQAIRPDPLRETAAAWHDGVHRDKVPEETREACARWLAESPEHRAAYLVVMTSVCLSGREINAREIYMPNKMSSLIAALPLMFLSATFLVRPACAMDAVTAKAQAEIMQVDVAMAISFALGFDAD
jgi:ferric-dicitrate binding protein FerR (iron transport regulator)